MLTTGGLYVSQPQRTQRATLNFHMDLIAYEHWSINHRRFDLFDFVFAQETQDHVDGRTSEGGALWVLFHRAGTPASLSASNCTTLFPLLVQNLQRINLMPSDRTLCASVASNSLVFFLQNSHKRFPTKQLKGDPRLNC